MAIVGVGAVEKRPVVIDDAVTIRLRAYMTIGYDHRVIDGAIADEFMQVVKKMIENWDRALPAEKSTATAGCVPCSTISNPADSSIARHRFASARG